MTSELLTIREVCELLKITRVTLWKLTRNGEIPAIKIGSAVRYRRHEVENSLRDMNFEPKIFAND